MHAQVLTPVTSSLRRVMIAACSLLAVSFMAATVARAEAPAPAEGEAFIRDVADRAFAIIGDEGLDDAARRAQLKELMDRHVAMDYIAQLVLGRHARPADGLAPEDRARFNADLAEYKSLFPQFIFNKLYDIIISKFKNAKVDVTGSSPVRNTDLFVHTRIARPGQEAVLADWRVRKDGKGEIKVIDVRAEGISLTITQRDEFASILGTGRNGLTPLLDHMRQNIATGGDAAAEEDGANEEGAAVEDGDAPASAD